MKQRDAVKVVSQNGGGSAGGDQLTHGIDNLFDAHWSGVDVKDGDALALWNHSDLASVEASGFTVSWLEFSTAAASVTSTGAS
ncbi:hypothetical protein GCM10017707_28990 [Paenarthrobacter aurescens]